MVTGGGGRNLIRSLLLMCESAWALLQIHLSCRSAPAPWSGSFSSLPQTDQAAAAQVGAEHLFPPSRWGGGFAAGCYSGRLHPSPPLHLPPPNLLADHLAELIHILEEHVVVGHGPDKGELATQAAEAGGGRGHDPLRASRTTRRHRRRR